MTKYTVDKVSSYLEYLDDLRDSGTINMFGARPYLMREFNLDGDTAGKILSFWMSSDLKEDAYGRAEQFIATTAEGSPQ